MKWIKYYLLCILILFTYIKCSKQCNPKRRASLKLRVSWQKTTIQENHYSRFRCSGSSRDICNGLGDVSTEEDLPVAKAKKPKTLPWLQLQLQRRGSGGKCSGGEGSGGEGSRGEGSGSKGARRADI
jgi:hypothetical protein